MICNICGQEIPDLCLEENLEKHLREVHFLSYSDYYEIVKLSNQDKCWKCGSPRYYLSPFLETFIPCLKCLNPKKSKEIREIRAYIYNEINSYLDLIKKNKHYQYLLSLSPIERSKCLPKSFEKMSEILNELKKKYCVRYEKTNLIEVKNILGTPGEISERNFNNLSMISHQSSLEQKDNKFVFHLTPHKNLYILPPEIVKFDYRHHSRYSILNRNSTRKSKRIRLDSGECLKFWMSTNQTVRSIFYILDENGNNLQLGDLEEKDQFRLKQELLVNPVTRTRIIDIYNEIIKYTTVISDSVFLLNTTKLPVFLKKPLKFILSWSGEDQGNETQEDTEEILVKLSIL